jgi:uncharacterized protein (TIGR02001 family)
MHRIGRGIAAAAALLLMFTGPVVAAEEEVAAEDVPGAGSPVGATEESAAPAKPEKKSWLPGGLSGNVSIVTDYSFRGISQTNRHMALQGGLDWAHDTGIHLGLWGSSVDFGDAFLEQDFYGGYAGAFGDFSYDVLGTFFFYPDDEQFNYWEFALNTAYDFEVAKLSAGFLGSPDYFGTLGTGFYLSTGVNVPLPFLENEYFDTAFDAKFGYTNAEEPFFGSRDQYLDWSTALVFTLPFNLALDFRYVDTDLSNNVVGSTDADARFVFGAKYSF